MAPNRKANVDIVDRLSSLNVARLVQPPKFIPLTHPSQQLSPSNSNSNRDNGVIYADHVGDKSHPANSYWDWDNSNDDEKAEAKNEKILKDILQEEEARVILLVEHIAGNIRRQASLLNDKTSPNAIKSENDDYWFEPNEQVATSASTSSSDMKNSSSSSDAYWTWPTMTETEKKQQLIEEIQQEEEIREMLSIDHIEKNIIAQAQLYQDALEDDAHRQPLNAENDAYWTWPEPQATSIQDHPSSESSNLYWNWPGTEREVKALVILNILYEEQIRQTLGGDHIQEMLEQEAARQHIFSAHVNTTAVVSGAVNASYWVW